MGLQGFEGCDIPGEPGGQLQVAEADCAEEDGGPVSQRTDVQRIGQVMQLELLPCQALGLQQGETTLAWRTWICVGTSTSPTPPWAGGKELVSTRGNRAVEGAGAGKAAES